jgi:hypothetical protein
MNKTLLVWTQVNMTVELIRLLPMSNELPEMIDAEPQQLASVQARLGSFLLDLGLMISTPGRPARLQQSDF